MGMLLNEPGRRLTFAFGESQFQLTVTLVVATLLHTRAPTGKFFGPDGGLLLSRPMTFQVIGVTVSVACANIGTNRPRTAAPSSLTPLPRTSRSPVTDTQGPGQQYVCHGATDLSRWDKCAWTALDLIRVKSANPG